MSTSVKSLEEKKAARRAYLAGYNSTPKAKVYQAEYRARPEVQVAKRAISAKFKASTEGKELLKEAAKRYRAKPEVKLARRNWILNRNYGISLEIYDKMLIESCGKCAICKLPFQNSTNEPVIDHDHATNKVRGLLHSSCNSALGFLNENHATLLGAIEYLKLDEPLI